MISLENHLIKLILSNLLISFTECFVCIKYLMYKTKTTHSPLEKSPILRTFEDKGLKKPKTSL